MSLDLENRIEELVKEEIKKHFDAKKEEIQKKIENKIKNFKLQIKIPSIVETSTGEFERVHKDTKKILKLASTKTPIYLYGEAGVGKTTICKNVAQLLEVDFYSTGAIMDSYKLLGYNDANGNYVETEFYKAFKNGGLFLFDELDASSSEAIVALNSALANGFVNFPCGRIEANENFYCVASGNTNCVDTSRYSARNELDLSTLDRFLFVEIDYDEDLEKELAKDYPDLFDKFIKCRRYFFNNAIDILCSTRSLINMIKLYANGFDLETCFKMTVLKGQPRERFENIWENI